MSDAPHGIDEGYVKYVCDWAEGDAPDAAFVDELNRWRTPLYAAGLIGHDDTHDVGFGNISVRAPAAGQFVISGTQTGHIAETTGAHYALVTDVDIPANHVRCTGPIHASSEAMTHAALYALDAEIGAVVHVHSRPLWEHYLDRLPTTDASVAYGTPAMAAEFERLWRESEFAERRIAVMAGHDDGLLSIGPSLADAAQRMLDLRASRQSGSD